MHNDVEQANPASYPLYFKNGQKYVCHDEDMSVSLCVCQQIPQDSSRSSERIG